MLLVWPTPTCTSTGPDLLQLVLVVFFLPLPGINTPLAHVVMITHCKFALVVFFLPATGANAPLALVQLALCGGGCVGVHVCGGGGSCIYIIYVVMVVTM